MSLTEIIEEVQWLIGYRADEIGYYDEDDTIIQELKDIKNELKVFIQQVK